MKKEHEKKCKGKQARQALSQIQLSFQPYTPATPIAHTYRRRKEIGKEIGKEGENSGDKNRWMVKENSMKRTWDCWAIELKPEAIPWQNFCINSIPQTSNASKWSSVDCGPWRTATKTKKPKNQKTKKPKKALLWHASASWFWTTVQQCRCNETNTRAQISTHWEWDSYHVSRNTGRHVRNEYNQKPLAVKLVEWTKTIQLQKHFLTQPQLQLAPKNGIQDKPWEVHLPHSLAVVFFYLEYATIMLVKAKTTIPVSLLTGPRVILLNLRSQPHHLLSYLHIKQQMRYALQKKMNWLCCEGMP